MSESLPPAPAAATSPVTSPGPSSSTTTVKQMDSQTLPTSDTVTAASSSIPGTEPSNSGSNASTTGIDSPNTGISSSNAGTINTNSGINSTNAEFNSPNIGTNSPNPGTDSSNAGTAFSSVGSETTGPLSNAGPSISSTPDVPSSNSTISDVGFINSTRTEMPFSDSDLTDFDTTTEPPTFYTDYSVDDNETYNPFLANDYDYYYYNPDVEREPYDYTPVDQEAKREEALALWKNVDIPPKVNYADFTPRDLDPYFLVLPPVLCLAFLLLVFVPCFVLKLRDDIREISGKERKWGSRRYKKQKNIPHESFQAIDPEWQLGAGGKDVSGNAFRDVQYVKPGASGSSNTYDKADRLTMGLAKENPAYIEENEVCTKQPKPTLRSDPSVDYSEEDVASASGNDLADSDDANVEPESMGLSDKDNASVNGRDGTKLTENSDANMTTYPKFTGWNKDLYSNGSGFGPPGQKTKEGAEDPSWGMY